MPESPHTTPEDEFPPKYKRVLLKISGEALIGPDRYGIHPPTLQRIATEISDIHNQGIEIALVIGGGNIFRGVKGSAEGMDRASADYMGMVATLINALAMQDALEKMGTYCRVQSAIEMQAVAEPYIRRRADRHLEKGRVVIFAGGTGNPYFTTDTAAALRAMEIRAEIILKATKVAGIYDADPMTNPDAKLYRELTYDDVLQQHLRVMDATAISLCRENDMPIVVFSLSEPGAIPRVAKGESVGTLVSSRRTVVAGEEE